MALNVQKPSTTLLLDLGNTRLKLGLWQASRHMQFLGAHAHQDEETLLAWLTKTLNQLPAEPTRAFGVSVASQALMLRLEFELQKRSNAVQLNWVWPEAKAMGLTNTYPNPRQLGADRWAGMLGLMHNNTSTDRSIILANFGTATTIDTLSREKHFLGGLILPGVSMMQNTLSAGTARLPLAQGEIQDHPTNTHAAITTGIVAAQLGAMRRQIELSALRDDRLPTLCVSGGAWEQLRAQSKKMLPDIEIQELPHIVLDGLSLVAKHTNHEHRD